MRKSKPTIEETLKWLAANSYLEVNVVGQNEQEFKKRYRRIKGRLPKRGLDYNVAKDAKIKGGDEFRLVIPEKDEQYRDVLEIDFGLAPLRATPNKRGWRKGDKDFAYFLLKSGFDVGHQVARSAGRRRASVSKIVKRIAKGSARDRQFIDGLKREVVRELTIRNQTVVRLAKLLRPCMCEVCNFDFGQKYGLLGEGFIEGHHKKPVSSYGRGGKAIRARDIVLVCSNCHRMLHRGKGISDWRKLRKLVRKLAGR